MGPAGAPAEQARKLLAPTGRLRVGAFAGSPLSMVRDRGSGEIDGLSVEPGMELARRLDVPFGTISNNYCCN